MQEKYSPFTLFFRLEKKPRVEEGRYSKGPQVTTEDTLSTLAIIISDGNNISTCRPTEEPLPYDRDGEDAFIPELIAAAAPMEMVPTTPHMFPSPMTRFLASVEWDHSESLLCHVYQSYAWRYRGYH
ncbi:hypothetical protein RJT34_24863 [Clitoria ternatea]|uniref:Uncharacterized protein n=1 Tax=Clitoria ternatea TaxID=43366 RepID=A0AAN9IJJ7_CLITE